MSRLTLQHAQSSVFAPVPVVSFSSGQFDDCGQYLAKRTADTECVPIVDERQLLMAADGKIAETGYRFNAVGFLAVCNALISGLNSVFSDLSGENRNKHSDSIASGDFAAAVTIYNTALRARFELLRERTLLINHREKTIEGFLGIEHRLLDNAVFINLVDAELKDAQPNATFYRAEVIGRELRLYYVDPKTRRNDLYPDPRHVFAAGWFFSNREDTGLAIRAAKSVLTKFGPAIEPRKSNMSVRHIGADLVGRTISLIRKSANDAIEPAQIERNVARLQTTSLNFSGTKVTFDAALDHWTEYLMRFKISRELAKQVCRHAALFGSEIDTPSPTAVYEKDAMAARTLYDLFCALLKQSRTQYHAIKDAMQIAAFQMLIP